MVAGLHTIALRPTDKSKIIAGFGRYLLRHPDVQKRIKTIAQGTKVYSISFSLIQNLKLYLPPLSEQHRIVAVLETWDKAISLTKRLIEQKEIQKKHLMRQLLTGKTRLKGFSGKWKKTYFKNIFNTVKGTKALQIKTNEYLKYGKYPVIDQGGELIAAFSDNSEKLFKQYPVIIFGDHTRTIKFIDFPFIIGADGTQLLKSSAENEIKFLYYLLLNTEIINMGYCRHLSILKEKFFKIPIDIKEQQAIAEILSVADKEISLLKEKLAKLQQQKKGLMQILLTGKVRLN